MLRHCLQLDLRRDPDAARPVLQAGEALLVLSKTPPANPAWVLVDGPSAFFWVEHGPVTAVRSLAEHSHELRGFLRRYKEILRDALAGQENTAAVTAYVHDMEEHFQYEETVLYPRLAQFLGHDRPGRELGYEHQGIRRYLGELLPFLEQCRAGEAAKKQVDQFEMKLYHLMEHHFAREEEAVFPLLERVETL